MATKPNNQKPNDSRTLVSDGLPTPEAVEYLYDMAASQYAQALHVGRALLESGRYNKAHAALIEKLTADGQQWEAAVKAGLREHDNAALNTLLEVVGKVERQGFKTYQVKL